MVDNEFHKTAVLRRRLNCIDTEPRVYIFVVLSCSAPFRANKFFSSPDYPYRLWGAQNTHPVVQYPFHGL